MVRYPFTTFTSMGWTRSSKASCNGAMRSLKPAPCHVINWHITPQPSIAKACGIFPSITHLSQGMQMVRVQLPACNAILASNPITPSPQPALFDPATPPPILPVATHSSYLRCSRPLALYLPLPVALRIFRRLRMLAAIRRTNWLSGRRGGAAGRRGRCAGGQHRRVCVHQP